MMICVKMMIPQSMQVEQDGNGIGLAASNPDDVIGERLGKLERVGDDRTGEGTIENVLPIARPWFCSRSRREILQQFLAILETST